MKKRIETRVLLVEDNSLEVEQLKAAFTDLKCGVLSLVHAGLLEEALSHLRGEAFDIVFLDLGLPDSQGVNTFLRLHECAPTVPVLVLAGTDDEAIAVQAVEEGAQDYLVKQHIQPPLLACSIRYAIERSRLEQALAETRQKQQQERQFDGIDSLSRSPGTPVTAWIHAGYRLRDSNNQLETKVRERTARLEAANKELDSFCHSVSHDLQAPLRAIQGFAQMLDEDQREKLDPEGRRNLDRILDATVRMNELIDDLLKLSRVSRMELRRQAVNLSELSRKVIRRLQQLDPDRLVQVVITGDLEVRGDARLIMIMMENLLGNAWKFTSKRTLTRIAVGAFTDASGRQVCYVRDNGAGFDMAYAAKLFGTFQRLHTREEFPGTGIGLATVRRIINLHSGQIWAESTPDGGATFFFVLDPNELPGLKAASPVLPNGSAASERFVGQSDETPTCVRS